VTFCFSASPILSLPFMSLQVLTVPFIATKNSNFDPNLSFCHSKSSSFLSSTLPKSFFFLTLFTIFLTCSVSFLHHWRFRVLLLLFLLVGMTLFLFSLLLCVVDLNLLYCVPPWLHWVELFYFKIKIYCFSLFLDWVS